MPNCIGVSFTTSTSRTQQNAAVTSLRHRTDLIIAQATTNFAAPDTQSFFYSCFVSDLHCINSLRDRTGLAGTSDDPAFTTSLLNTSASA